MLTADVYRVLYSFIKIQIRTNRFFVDFTQFLPLQRTFFFVIIEWTQQGEFLLLILGPKNSEFFTHEKKKLLKYLHNWDVSLSSFCRDVCCGAIPLSYRDSEGEDKDTYVEVREIFFLLMKFSGEKDA